MATDSIGTARLDIVVDTSQLEVAIERAKSRTASMAQDAQKQYATLNAAEKRRVDGLLRQADTLGFTREQQVAYNAALKTSGPLLDDITRRLAVQRAAAQGATTQLTQYGMSAKQTAFALRGVPAQITDIVTSLQGGQNPLTVLLQQGGQLRDMFGGIRPAVSALAGSLAGLINPMTVTAALGGALAFAWHQGNQEIERFNEAIILTGNYANLTADDLARIADEMDDLGGVTGRSAAAALAQVASTGKFTGEQLQLVALAAEQMRVATGKSIDDTVAEFTKLREDPVKGILELNEKYHFLTQTQLDNIVVLKEQGREQEAVSEAFRIHADTINSRAQEITESLGLVSGALRGIKSAAAETWDSLVQGIQDADQEARKGLDSVATFMARLTQLRSGSPFAVMSFGANPTAPAAAPRPTATVDSAAARKRLEEQKKAREEFDRFTISNLSKQEKLEREIVDIKAAGLKAGKSQADIDKAIADARARYAEQEARSSRKRKETDPTAALLDRVRTQTALNQEQLKSEESLSASERLRVQVLEELDRISNKVTSGRRAEITAALEQLTTTGQLVEKSKEEVKAKEQLARLQTQLDAQSANRRAANELELMQIGRGGDSVEQLQRRLDIEREYTEGLKQIRDRGVAENTESYRQQEAALRASRDRMLAEEEEFQQRRLMLLGDWRVGAQAAYEDYLTQAADVATRSRELFTNSFQTIEDAIVSFATTGKMSFKALLTDISAEIARFMIKKAVVQFIGMFASMFSSNGTNLGATDTGSTGFTMAAKGGVFDGSAGLSQYSNSVVNQPTPFLFAKGAGLMGEAGPEAIMPLTRTAGGQLGVKAIAGGGGGVTVNQYITVNSDGTSSNETAANDQDVIAKAFSERMRAVTQEEIVRMMRPGGLLNRAGVVA